MTMKIITKNIKTENMKEDLKSHYKQDIFQINLDMLKKNFTKTNF